MHQAELFLYFALINHCLWVVFSQISRAEQLVPKCSAKQIWQILQQRLKMHMVLGQQIDAPLLGHVTPVSWEPNVQSGVHILEYMLGLKANDDLTEPSKKSLQKVLKYKNSQTSVGKFSAPFQLRLMGTRSQSHRNGFVTSLYNLYLCEKVAHFF